MRRFARTRHVPASELEFARQTIKGKVVKAFESADGIEVAWAGPKHVTFRGHGGVRVREGGRETRLSVPKLHIWHPYFAGFRQRRCVTHEEPLSIQTSVLGGTAGWVSMRREQVLAVAARRYLLPRQPLVPPP